MNTKDHAHDLQEQSFRGFLYKSLPESLFNKVGPQLY